jgi:Mrp family chromosome partitioning ATPase
MDRRAPRKPAPTGAKSRAASLPVNGRNANGRGPDRERDRAERTERPLNARFASSRLDTDPPVPEEEPVPSVAPEPRAFRVAARSDEPDLRSALRILRRRLPVIGLVTALLVALGGFVAVTGSTSYEATAELLLRRPSAVVSTGADSGDPDRVIRNEVRFIESQVTRDLVESRLGHEGDVSVSSEDGDDLVTITATSEDAEDAAAVANAYAQAYLDLRTGDLQAEADALRAQIDAINERLQENIPTDNVAALVEKRAGLEGELLQLEPLLAGVGDGPRVVTRAEVPESPASRGLLGNLIATAVIGALLGCVVAVAIEVLSRRVHDEIELERVSGVATLTTLDQRHRRRRRRHTTDASDRALRLLLFPVGSRAWPTVVAITSVARDNSAARVAAGLGRACAAAGQRVLLVGADLHGSRLGREVGVSGDVGFANVLGAGVPLDEAVHSVPNHHGLSVVVAGTPNGDDLLATPRATITMQRARSRGEVVLVEAAPVEDGGDGLTVAAHADATVLLVPSGTKEVVVERAVRNLERAGASLRGTVLVVRRHARRPWAWFR